MPGKVCMFVWNYFTHDSRVLREATALAESGYEVDVVAVYDRNNKELLRREKINNFTVIRVPRYPYLLLDLLNRKNNLKKAMRNLKKFPEIKMAIKIFKGNTFVWILSFLLIVFISLYVTNTIIPRQFCLYSIYVLFPILCINLAYRLFRLLLKSKKILRKINWLYVVFKMSREGLRKKYDFYHSNDLNTLTQGCICKLLRRKKLIYDSHEMQTDRMGYYGKKFYYYEKFLIKMADKIMTVNNSIAEYIKNLYKIDKPTVVHNYPFYKIPEGNKINLHKLLKIPEIEPILLYQGGIAYGRGIEEIIKAIPEFNKGIVVFIGDGSIKDKIVKMCERKKIKKSVRFLPFVPVDKIIDYTRCAYLGFCLIENKCKSYYYSLPNKLFEYIMAGVPILASAFPEMKKIIENEKVGVVINKIKGRDIANAVNSLLADTEEYIEYKNNCIKVRDKYNWDNEKEIFIKTYNGLYRN